MPEPTVIRFEATEALADLLDDQTAMLTMQTKEGRIAVWMKRPVFVSLFREMQHALGQEPGSALPPAKP
jgi:hypothetical protein